MPSKVGRNYLNLCFTKIKRPTATQSSPMNPAPASQATDHDQSRPFSSMAAATFIKNYNSLYEYTFDNSTAKSFAAHSTSSSSPSSFSNDEDPEACVAADFVTAFTSHRFFFSSPGRSNSIIESTTSPSSSTSTSSTTSESGDLLFNNSMAIPTSSPDPYADFRRSMQEMVEAREQMDIKQSSWEFLHELLLCYLALNPKSTHKYILGAFADLANLIKPSLPPPPPERAAEGSGNRESEPASGGFEISGEQNDRDRSIMERGVARKLIT